MSERTPAEERKRIETEILATASRLNRLAREARQAGVDVTFAPLRFSGKAPPQGFRELDVIIKKGVFSL